MPIQLFAPTGRPYVVGHRGARGHAPENTLASFRTGVELGAQMLELDVHLSADGQLVVIHDDTVDRTTNGSGAVAELRAAEIQRLDAGSWYSPAFAGERVPLLGEVLDWARGRANLLIELKLGPVWYDGIEARLAATLRAHDAIDDVLVISLDHHALRRVKELDPTIRTAIIYGARPIDPIAMARAAMADAVRPFPDLLTAEDVALLRAAGLAVIPCTVNSEQGMRRMISLGVDGMSTDYPDRLSKLLDSDR